jgi:hypothetical protein
MHLRGHVESVAVTAAGLRPNFNSCYLVSCIATPSLSWSELAIGALDCVCVGCFVGSAPQSIALSDVRRRRGRLAAEVEVRKE